MQSPAVGVEQACNAADVEHYLASRPSHTGLQQTNFKLQVKPADMARMPAQAQTANNALR